ncbi:metallophosphatase [Nitratireductor aestuarii]|uniref:Metallophosphatase n=1 Tax=Nitratireductor aestuarii TaxID=1735103 RepID=A0A916RLQ8_9HYPH|nr:DNA repair exonuclease [Nitratireductor aestuarii]GGA59981.1 metallophosphatase [Nitratireductor aestuarii]
MLKFIHSSDLHLGKRFANMPEEIRGRLREARHAVLGKLAEAARDHGASVILIAGDTFDTETPSPEIRRQTLAEMAAHAPLQWIILPGNHDSLQASQLWNALQAEAPANVVLAMEPRPIMLSADATLLPAPCTTRRPGRDLTEWVDNAATPDRNIRVCLAHGGILDFSEDGDASGIIAPDRAKRSGLDYLALGDWHGTMAVDPRTHYSGTPEPDRFKHNEPGRALAVEIPAAGAEPIVTPVETGTFSWSTQPLHLLSEDDPAALVRQLLPEGVKRRQTLMRILASGRTRPDGRASLAATIEHAAPEFAFLALDDAGLETDCEAGDLDAIDKAGALRIAAEELLTDSDNTALSAAERQVAREALLRLFSYSQKIAS